MYPGVLGALWLGGLLLTPISPNISPVSLRSLRRLWNVRRRLEIPSFDAHYPTAVSLRTPVSEVRVCDGPPGKPLNGSIVVL